MDAAALTGYIRQEVRKEVYADRIELYLPFYFGQGDFAPLCLTWDKNGVLSDGGRILAELKKRLGDLAPYRQDMDKILALYGQVALEGGQKLVVRHFQTCISGEETYLDYMGGLNRLLRVASLLSVVDRLSLDGDGRVKLC
ncbi:MAG: hypothetical protein IKA47_10190 [Oscillospiraceae bacterium]|nr:hypothetical protein [Oscillospiraceae bacterium]